MKQCTSCKEIKTLEDFYKSATYKDGYGYRCKVCDYVARNAYHKKHYHSVREKLRINTRKSKYGLTDEDFRQMLSDQGGKCAICDVELNEDFAVQHAPNKLVVDHCHTNGHVRGLLCTMCNKALGLLKEDPGIVKKAFEYLESNEVKT